MGKKLLLFSALCYSFLQLSAQVDIERKGVLVEIFTGTWCVFCPGAALAADDMIQNGHEVSIVKWHWDDPYQTPEAVSRMQVYSINSFPTQVFDGTNKVGNGHPTTSMYPTYLVHFNNAKNVLTPIDLTASISLENDQYTIEAVAHQVASLPTGASANLYVVVTESHIQDSWYGLTEVNSVQRDMLGGISGTALNLTVGSTDTVSFVYQPDPSMDLKNTKFVFFIQDPASRQTYNSWTMPAKMNDVKVETFATPLDDFRCPSTPFKPEISFRNAGSETLTSMTVIYGVNNESPKLMNWTGNVKYDEEAILEIPADEFDLNNGVNTINVEFLNPNGKADQVISDNTIDGNWVSFPYKSGEFDLVIQPDFFGAHITWEVKDPSGAVIASGGPYNHTDTTRIYTSFDLGADPGCHDFRIYDEGGNGLTSIYPGFFKLIDPQGNIVMESTDGDFGEGTGGPFEVVYPTAVDVLEAGVVKVYPNPTSDRFSVYLEEFTGKEVKMDLYQMNGAKLASVETVDGQYQFDLSKYPDGVYLLKVRTEQGHHLQKIAKQ